MSNIQIFQSDIVSMKDVCDLKFTIPTYQRPYVWGDEQIKKLLDDFHHAFEHNPNDFYYVSTILTKDSKDSSKVSELIDGQQRFTTLWLISFVILNLAPNSQIKRFLKEGNKLRFDFEIRTEVLDYLESLLKLNNKHLAKKSVDIESKPYVINIAKGLATIDGYLKQILESKGETELQNFGDFIFKNVKLIKNTTPDKTDLNKLFSTINSAGVQLEQTDIIKANLLHLIDEKVKYGRIWDACENMNNYFERNVNKAFPSQSKHLNLENFTPFQDDFFSFDTEPNENEQEYFSIDDLDVVTIKSYESPERKADSEENREGAEDVYCRSIISFGQLLIHTYRIHLKREEKGDFEGTFHVNRIIEIFKPLQERNDPEEIKRFFKLLWDVRYVFDKYIIKWITDNNTKNESLELVNISQKTNGYYPRNKIEKKSSSLMLQSVLYFTGDYLRQYWLTPYINYLLDNHQIKDPTNANHLIFLEKLDNYLSLNRKTNDKDLTFQILSEGITGNTSDVDIPGELNSAKGTGFRHYWFQKLEYILWKNWENKDDVLFKNFRITSKNSIEHIYPQNPENGQNLEPAILDSFGNLVLLSVSQNSEYSNKPVSVKKSMFNEKRDTYDSLKSYDLFSKFQVWNKDTIEKHKNEMIEKIMRHYQFNK